MEYTKGNWEVRVRAGYPKLKYAIECPKQERTEIICNTRYGTNARLISAAPDMYEALKLLQSALTEYRLRDVKKRYSLCLADAAASNAIAKAEGK